MTNTNVAIAQRIITALRGRFPERSYCGFNDFYSRCELSPDEVRVGVPGAGSVYVRDGFVSFVGTHTDGIRAELLRRGLIGRAVRSINPAHTTWVLTF